MATLFCIPVPSFSVAIPFFIVIGFVLFFFGSLVRFPSSFQLGVRALGGTLTLLCLSSCEEPLGAVMPSCSYERAHSRLGHR